ncbi:anti-sigma factor [Streptomyces sp. NPDC006879]|uniref:anti-sigma factor n=1 Tax=Streptomyces sp. NPDC006879 TaxID=3364767 RepID=UPI0036C2F72A
MKNDELHTLTGAYALDALTEPEHHAFLNHLKHCPTCTHETHEFTATTTRLATATTTPPPPHLKHTVLTTIDSVRQLPPKLPPTPHTTTWTTRLTRTTRHLTLAAALTATTTLGGLALWQNNQTQQARQQTQQTTQHLNQLTHVLNAPDARTTHAQTTTGAHITLTTSPQLNQAVFISTDLPNPPTHQTYQLWFDDNGTMRPAGTFQNNTALLTQDPPNQATAIGLTLEPQGGSPQPTTTPLLLLNLPT